MNNTQAELLRTTTEHLFRHESGKMLSVLVRLFGLKQVEIAEDIVQETLISALETWKLKGLPDNPRAWLYRVAKNKTIDFLRRERNFRSNIAPDITHAHERAEAAGQWLDPLFLDHEIEDAQLRMMFACCHPGIPAEAQLVLILRTLCGLSAREIAVALLEQEASVQKRLYRAKEKIKEQQLLLEVPSGTNLLPRMDAVLQAIYLLFNEGYKSASTVTVIRHDLCEEAIRLCVLLAGSKAGNLPKTHALLSVLCFHASRFDARLDASGDIILLEHQDRSKWHQGLIARGYEHLHLSKTDGAICEYHIEAAIASYHASAPSFAQTNWKGIFYCYELLMQINPSPFIQLNRAIAQGYADGASAGIEALRKIVFPTPNYLYFAALGDFLAKNAQPKEAIQAWKQGITLAQLPAERRLLEVKIQYLQGL